MVMVVVGAELLDEAVVGLVGVMVVGARVV